MTDIKTTKKQKKLDFNEFRQWLSSLNLINPTLHVNGIQFTSAVLTVDFGTPLVEQKLTPEQNAELVTRMRSSVKSLHHDKEKDVRIQTDTVNGIWWASIG
jgi:hypothetical protein